jgi:oxygen-independent coproporphyrinogen-3 oxidase
VTDRFPRFPIESPPWISPRAAYVHIPFCAHHCGYCDFAVVTGLDHRIDAYLDALADELATLNDPRPVDSIFLGGGTPSHLDPRQIDRLLNDIRRWLPARAGAECTIEVNPESFDRVKARLLASAGWTRVSIGVQSFRPETLHILERTHEPRQVSPAIEAARAAGAAVCLDLIFGVPGQSLADWRTDLRQALEFEPDHVSVYGLTFEKGTRLWKQRHRGSLSQLDEQTELEMYRLAIDTLESSGLAAYEISNFARPGAASRHNQVYWANHAFFGFGMGAASYLGGTRTLNVRNLPEYVQRCRAGRSPVFQSETLAPEDRARETMALNLRRVSGLNRHEFREQTGFDVDALAKVAIERLSNSGLMTDDGVTVRLTRSGRYVADSIVAEIL